MTRIYTIWPADKEGLPASTSGAWQQDRRWLVLDVSEGLDAACIVEGPVSREEALRRELELRATALGKGAPVIEEDREQLIVAKGCR